MYSHMVITIKNIKILGLYHLKNFQVLDFLNIKTKNIKQKLPPRLDMQKQVGRVYRRIVGG